VNATPDENFGVTLLEAAAFSLPVIASPTGWPKEILKGYENGWIEALHPDVQVGIATGRSREVTQQALADYDLPVPDFFICSAGSEIFYSEDFADDKGWRAHIDFQWKKNELQSALADFPGLHLQEPAAQKRFKLSYYIAPDFNNERLTQLYRFMRDRKLHAKVLVTENRFLDLLPFRASKGSAVRYLSAKWKIPLDQIITAGNSGNDLDMLKGKTKGIVVANYSPELEVLRSNKSVYFARNILAQGVLEGVEHYLANDLMLAPDLDPVADTTD